VRVVALESATALLVVPVAAVPLDRFDQSHHPIIAATMSNRRINSHGAPRFFSSILISATLPPLPGVKPSRVLLQRLFRRHSSVGDSSTPACQIPPVN
jgi:hypothetical protein